jgi:sugar phosphate isomerase/epimerase
MVFGEDVVHNVQMLDGRVSHVEIVLFYTPSLHNLPEGSKIRWLRNLGEQAGITFSVHLPASMEIASAEKSTRRKSLHLAKDWCLQMGQLNPTGYVLHIPCHTPTLTPVPGLYFRPGDGWPGDDWTERAKESLAALHEVVPEPGRLLVENINYSPAFLEPFYKEGLCALCLDLGHLILGQENVMESMKKYLGVTREVHLHGVTGHQEHLSLSALLRQHVHQWVRLLMGFRFEGTLILEVFTPQDLEESIDIVLEKFCKITAREEKRGT